MAFEKMSEEDFDSMLASMSDDEINEARLQLDLEIEAEKGRLNKMNREHEKRDLAAHAARQAELAQAQDAELQAVAREGKASGDIPQTNAS